MRRGLTCGLLAVALTASLNSIALSAQSDSLSVKVRRAELAPDGLVNLIVSLSGPGSDGVLPATSFHVFEGGKLVDQLVVEPQIERLIVPVAVALVTDVSGSTKGEPIESAKAAAISFIERLPDGVVVQLISFASTAKVETDFTADRSRLTQAINGLSPGGETAIYDAVFIAAQNLSALPDHQHNIVLFSDGGDTASTHTIEEATASASGAKASVTSVGLITPDLAQGVLDGLAGATEGRSIPVSRSSELLSAFEQIARDIASQYVLRYSGSDFQSKEIAISVKVDAAGIAAQDDIVVVNLRENPPVEPAKPERKIIAAPTPHVLAPVGLYLGTAAAFAALLMLAWVVAMSRKPRAVALLARALTPVGAPGRRKASPHMSFTAAIAKGTVDAVERIPKPKGYEEKLQTLLERAAWPLRPSEFLVLQGIAGFGGMMIGAGLFGRLPLGILLAITGAYATRVILRRRVEKRESAFLAQLPDTLQLLAGSLQAGYGLTQALDTVSKESGPPASIEFSRVLAETRLGMPLDEALEGMAQRVGNEDFTWVVMAIKIQRQVGGNLAVLLETVAGTLRERERLRRQVKVLAAEGRLSAWILSLMPFLLALYMAMVNPAYLGTLFETGVGRLMLAGGLAAMAAGVVWMRKITRIEV